VETLTPDSGHILTILGGLAIGAVVGAAALLSNFCALGGVADILFARDWRRMRAWLLAAGVALLGTQILDALGVIHIDRVLLPHILWLPALIGGVCFGFGMALAGGCINRALVRLGVGSFKSLVTLAVVGVTAALTLEGPLAHVNRALARMGSVEVMIAPDAIHRIVGAVPAVDAATVQWLAAVLGGGGLLIFSLKDAWFRQSRDQVAAGILIGLAIPTAWTVSDSRAALDFATPAGQIVLAFTAALSGKESIFSLSMAAVLGVPLGAFLAGLATRNLARQTFADRTDLMRHIVGAILMGFGGTMALGCTFGQGLSGFSTLSITALIAVAGILFGCLWGIRTFEAESLWGGLKLTLKRGV